MKIVASGLIGFAIIVATLLLFGDVTEWLGEGLKRTLFQPQYFYCGLVCVLGYLLICQGDIPKTPNKLFSRARIYNLTSKTLPARKLLLMVHGYEFYNPEHIVNIQDVIKKLIGEFEIDISVASH